MDTLSIIIISLVILYFLDRSIFSSEPRFLGDWEIIECGLKKCKDRVSIVTADYDPDAIYFCNYECEFKSCGLVGFALRKIGELLGIAIRWLILAGCIGLLYSLFNASITTLLALILIALIFKF